MRPEGNDDPELKCPVDHQTREKWLEAAKAKKAQLPAAPSPSPLPTPSSPPPLDLRFSLDSLTWQPRSAPPSALSASASASTPNKKPKLLSLSQDREISTIPRAFSEARPPNAAERAAMPPANAQGDTGHDRESGNWIYPSQEMFFNAMKRKGHEAQAQDMSSIVPIHNAVNERAWAEIKRWEEGRGSEACGGPKLVSFSGDSKALTPKARWNSLVGYAAPFDRHDWVVDRCGKHVDYVIDFYSGKNEGLAGKSLNFYLDVRPKLNTWEGVKMRVGL
ncbi:hypothetical protein D0862_09992 [Hortaea werneckii]|uniref:Holocytochrome c-type synthase n=1 Tax=Hortaea werneckii TaxID=91943 RepID=A0A3M7FN40_HORWE|nr:hypothetical protein D0862_09992 [Hortaea werneckii]